MTLKSYVIQLIFQGNSRNCSEGIFLVIFQISGRRVALSPSCFLRFVSDEKGLAATTDLQSRRLVTMTTKQLVEKITARVFCQKQGTGGNPVTIFSCPTTTSLSQHAQQQLAQSCAWESVMLNHERKTMSFYMPTGEPVSFCAHAAMGGVMQMIQQQAKIDDSTLPFAFRADMQPEQEYQAVLHKHDIVSLDMQADFTEQRIQHPPQLQRILRNAINAQAPDLVQPPAMLSHEGLRFPTFVNSSIARPKTLVYVNSVDNLNALRAPPVSDAFRIACDALQSTGLYLYSPIVNDDETNADADELVFECRQFPRASGYPEDPATGIAAAALAVSLHARGMVSPYYKFQQGTAMGKPSLIMVENIKRETTSSDEAETHTSVSFRLTGKVEVDSREEIEVEDDGRE